MLLITWVRTPAFIALAAGSFVVGLGARMPLGDIPRAFQQGVGDTLGFIAMVVGLGTVIGKLLAESGGAVVVSRVLVSALGEKRLDWAMLLSGFLIGLPVFFQVGLVLLAPVLFTAMRQTGTPMLRLAIPLVAGLSVCSRLRAAASRSARGHRAARRGHGAHALLFARRRPARRVGIGSVVRPLHQPARSTWKRERMADQLSGAKSPPRVRRRSASRC